MLSDTGHGGTDDMWLALLYDAAGREPCGWLLSRETAEEAHSVHLVELGLSAAVVWPPLHFRAPQPTHAAAEDALVEAWLWAMVEQVGRAGIADRSQREQANLVRRLGALVPPALWPRLAAGSRYRRRRDRDGHATW